MKSRAGSKHLSSILSAQAGCFILLCSYLWRAWCLSQAQHQPLDCPDYLLPVQLAQNLGKS